MHRVSIRRPAFEPRRRAVVAALLTTTLAPPSFARAIPTSSWTIVELGAGVDAGVSTGALAVNAAGIAAGWVGELPALFTPDGRAERLGDRAGRALGFDCEGRVIGRFFASDHHGPAPFVRRQAELVAAASPASAHAPDVPHAVRDDDDVALPGAFFSQAYGRNRVNDVVGTSDTGLGTAPRAALRPPRGHVIDLGALVPVRAAGWHQLHVAYAINDRGAVVGVGTRGDGAMRGFMLMPPR